MYSQTFLGDVAKENTQELLLGWFFSFNFMQARLNIYFLTYQPIAAGYRGGDLTFWQHY